MKKFIPPKITRSEVAKQTALLVENFCLSDSIDDKLFAIDILNKQLLTFPASRMVAVQVKFFFLKLQSIFQPIIFEKLLLYTLSSNTLLTLNFNIEYSLISSIQQKYHF